MYGPRQGAYLLDSIVLGNIFAQSGIFFFFFFIARVIIRYTLSILTGLYFFNFFCSSSETERRDPPEHPRSFGRPESDDGKIVDTAARGGRTAGEQ